MDSSLIATMAAELRAGLSLETVRQRHAVSPQLEKSLNLCERFGSPPARVLDRLAEVAVARERSSAELELAQAGPASSAKLVIVLPLVVVGLAQLAGLRVLNSPSPLTLASMALGGVLLFAGRVWSRRIVTRAAPNDQDPGVALDAFAAGMQGGLSTDLVRAAIAETYGRTQAIDELIETASRDGLAIADLALAEADRLRLEKRVADESRIRRAGVQLMWPLGLAVLPAFVLLAVIPLAAAMLQGN